MANLSHINYMDGIHDDEDWIKMFKESDVDGNGFMNLVEMRDMLHARGSHMSDKEICELFINLDGCKSTAEILDLMNNPNEKITMDKFVEGMKHLKALLDTARRLFKEYDADNSGGLDRTEIKKLLIAVFDFVETEEQAEEVAKNIFAKDDADNDGKISLEELISAIS